jgi:photosystem II stability/assembly factor-like uncharacterized protein
MLLYTSFEELLQMAKLLSFLLRAITAVLLVAASPLTAETGRWTPVGPDGGGPRVVAADPGAPGRLYAAFPWGSYGTLETLVLRTDNAGATWQASNHGLEGKRIIALAVDPSRTDRIYAVAAVGGCFSDDPGGVYRSDDAGAHWQLVATSNDVGGLACSVGLLALSDAVLVGTGSGVARSTDGGETWQQIPLSPSPSALHTLLRDPDNEQVVYAAGWLARFKSVDGGLSWTLLDDPASHGEQWVTAFAISASDPDTLYAFGLNDSVWRSRDGGATWSDELPAPFAYGLESVSLEVDPHDPETLFLGTEDGLWVSRTGGSSFQRLRRGLPEMARGRTAFPGVSDLTLDAAGRIFVATPKGLWSSTDAGRRWTAAAMHGVHTNTIRFLRFDPFNPRRFLFTSFDTLFEARNGGDTFKPLPLPSSGLLRAIEFDPFERGRLFAVMTVSDGGPPPVDRLFESRDGGRHWRAPASVPAGTVDLAVPAPQTLLAVANNAIYLRQADGVWRRQIQVEPSDERGWFNFSRLEANPTRPEVVFAIGFDNFLHGGSVPVIYRSLDAGQHWSAWDRGVNALAFDPGQPGTVYVARGEDIYRRQVAGSGSRKIGRIRPPEWPQALLVDPSDPQTFYATTNSRGVLVSHDGARTWSPLGSGLPFDGKLPITALEQDPLNPRRLYATPSTGGLWRLDLPPS